MGARNAIHAATLIAKTTKHLQGRKPKRTSAERRKWQKATITEPKSDVSGGEQKGMETDNDKPTMNGLYPYCDDCPIRFRDEDEMKDCGLYWRPKAATKQGFPANGWNCPRDTWNGMAENQKCVAKLAERED